MATSTWALTVIISRSIGTVKAGWFGEDVETKVRSLVQELGAPDILVIHCGGNSIGTCSLRGLQGFMKRIISNIFNMLPTYCKIVWSQILPRSYYIYMFSHVAAEKARKRINSSLSNFIRARGGCYINYPDLNVWPKIVPWWNTSIWYWPISLSKYDTECTV